MTDAPKVKAAFTPGPWDVVENDLNYGPPQLSDFLVNQRRDAQFTIAAVMSDFGANDEPQANARLIAAAPDLYEALKECRDQLWHLAKDKITNPWLKQASAALAKARGES